MASSCRARARRRRDDGVRSARRSRSTTAARSWSSLRARAAGLVRDRRGARPRPRLRHGLGARAAADTPARRVIMASTCCSVGMLGTSTSDGWRPRSEACAILGALVSLAMTTASAVRHVAAITVHASARTPPGACCRGGHLIVESSVIVTSRRVRRSEETCGTFGTRRRCSSGSMSSSGSSRRGVLQRDALEAKTHRSRVREPRSPGAL